jgi:hypothetical protein
LLKKESTFKENLIIKKPFLRLTKFEDNIKTDVRRTGYMDVNWLGMVQNHGQYEVTVVVMMKLKIPLPKTLLNFI